MLYVQSFWSKPMSDTQLNLKKAGWFNKRALFYGITLSALLLDKHNPNNTVLITDKVGKNILIDIIGLPYNQVIVELDYLNKYNSGLWALGKIFSYSLMEVPFIHFDFDFFLAYKLSDKFESSELCAWIPENSNNHIKEVYNPSIKTIKREFPKLHNKFNYFLEKNYRYAYNAGIIGGNHLEIYKELKEIVFYMVENNRSSVENCNQLNVVLEQYIFGCLAFEANKKVICLEETATFSKFSSQQSTHLLGPSKGIAMNCKEIEEILYSEFPEYYNKINYLLQNNLI